MIKTKRVTIFTLIALVALNVALAFAVVGNRAEKTYAADIFEYRGIVKTVAGDTDGTSKGLRLFAYDNGAAAEFRNVQTDIFQSEIKITSFGGNKDLKKYSLVFADEKSGKKFSVQVSAYSDYNDVAVIYNGEAGGIVYPDGLNTAYGVTAGYNEQGVYTKFSADVCSLTFDPESMQVRIKGDDGNYRLVWDFTKQYNDGKLLANDLTSFKEYTVSVVFDEIAANSRGDLLLLSFGGYSLDGDVKYRPSIIVTAGAKPVANEEYVLPSARAVSENGDAVTDEIKVAVYDEKGNLLVKNVGSFTPTTKGALYLYYEYAANGVTADAWYKTEVIDKSEITGEFAFDGEIPEKVGVNAEIFIPEATVITNAVAEGKESCLVTVKYGGSVVDNLEKVEGGFTLRLTSDGVYYIEYVGKTSYAYNKIVKTVTADESVLAVNAEDIPEEFAVGSEYEFPSAEFCLGKEIAEATAKIIAPSGKIESGRVKLSEAGKYSLRYEATLNGESYTRVVDFLVKKRYADGFDSNAEYAGMRTNNETKGVKITLTDNKTVTYDKTIDLSKYSFDDKTNTGKTLLQVSFDPKNIGTPDLDSFFVVLTDKYDSSNYISVRLKYLAYTPQGTYIRARSSAQSAWVGYYYDFMSTELRVDSATTHEEGGFIGSGCFTHTLSNYEFDTMSLQLYFDYETKCLYARPLWLTGHYDPSDKNSNPDYNSRIVPWLVYDFDSADPTLSAGNKPWNGFTTGEAILSVYAKGTSGSDAFIRVIDGEDLSKPLYDDKENPIIKIDVDENAVPTAKVGKPYKVFAYTATDNDSAIIEKGVTVINDASGKTFDISADGTFTPVEGTYTFRYYAVDAFGHRTEKKIKVTAKRNIDEPGIEVRSTMPSSAKYGDTITLADYEITNAGAGDARVDIEVRCGDLVIPVTHGSFECKGATGIYTVTYTVTDYIGQSIPVKKRINVTRDEGLSVDEKNINLPKAFIDGDEFAFETRYALYYDENLEENRIPCVITVTDGNGRTVIGKDGKYRPKVLSDGSDATVEISFERDGLKETITRKVPVKTAKNGDGYTANYFITENAEVSLSSNGVTFEVKTGKNEMSFSFVRPIYAGEAMLRFITYPDYFNADSFEVVLTDKENALQKVVLTYTKRGVSWYCSVNGGAETYAFVDADGYLQINYNNSAKTFTDANANPVGVVEKTVYGSDFGGFTSGNFYLDCKVSGINGVVRVGIRTINNQTINSVKRDMQKPYIKSDGKYEERVPSGTTVTIGSAIAYDVLSPIGEIRVEVKRGDETIVAEKPLAAGETFTANECGRYRITYRVSDKNGNAASDYVEFSVYDPIKPELTFNGKIADKVKVGATIKLPKYTISDDRKDEVSVHVYIIAPDGTSATVTNGKYTVKAKGTYTIVYLAKDPNDNFVIYRFIVKAE